MILSDESMTSHESIKDLPKMITRSMTIKKAFNPSSISLSTFVYVDLWLG